MSKTYEALKRAEALRAKRKPEGDTSQQHTFHHGHHDLPVNGSDDYYELRRRLIGSAVGDSVKTILVVSALHGEGASKIGRAHV